MTGCRPEQIIFRPVASADYTMLRDWLARPHWREWWGEPEPELGYIRDMVEGRDETCKPFIFSIGEEPAGYIQVWRIAPHQTPPWTADNPWLLELPADAVGVDLSLADRMRLGRGLGPRVLKAFVAMLREAGHRTIVIDPDPANARAVGAYRKAGFRPIPQLEGRFDDVLLMQHQADPDA